MMRAIILYEGTPDPDRYEQHVRGFIEGKFPGAIFRHGKVVGAPFGEPKYQYVAEFEWPDKDAFKEGTRSEEFMASGKDAMAMGVPFQVLFTEVR
jgi:hypothetical protein